MCKIHDIKNCKKKPVNRKNVLKDFVGEKNPESPGFRNSDPKKSHPKAPLTLKK